MIVLPYVYGLINFEAQQDSAIYWINEEPLLNYLNVKPNLQSTLNAAFFSIKQ